MPPASGQGRPKTVASVLPFPADSFSVINDLEAMVQSAVAQIFDTMLSMKLELLPPNAKVENGEPQVAGSVGFSGSQLSGVVYIYSSVTFAQKLTAALLGLEEREITGSEMVNDAVGEMANMIVGQLKSELCDRGIMCVLTVPSIVRGANFTIRAVSSTSRRVLTFQCGGNHQLVVDALVRPAKT